MWDDTVPGWTSLMDLVDRDVMYVGGYKTLRNSRDDKERARQPYPVRLQPYR